VIKNSMYGIYFARCMNIFNSLLPQLVKYDVHTTRKINSIHAIFYHILSLYRYLIEVILKHHYSDYNYALTNRFLYNAVS